MKALFDNHSRVASKKVTRMYMDNDDEDELLTELSPEMAGMVS